MHNTLQICLMCTHFRAKTKTERILLQEMIFANDSTRIFLNQKITML